MVRRSKERFALALVAGLSLFGAASAVAASGTPLSDIASARLAWAERHVELVCRPLQARGFDRDANRCYGQAARVSRSALAGPEVTGSVGETALMLSAPPARRCSGIKCLEMFSSLGVGF